MKFSLLNKISSKEKSSKGKQGENIACHYLKKQGLKIIDKNFHSRFGEIDIILKDKDTVVFTEVRYRKNKDYGGPLESITPQKQDKIRKTALIYLQKNNGNMNMRFDVLAICGENLEQTSQLEIEWIKNAF